MAGDGPRAVSCNRHARLQPRQASIGSTRPTSAVRASLDRTSLDELKRSVARSTRWHVIAFANVVVSARVRPLSRRRPATQLDASMGHSDKARRYVMLGNEMSRAIELTVPDRRASDQAESRTETTNIRWPFMSLRTGLQHRKCRRRLRNAILHFCPGVVSCELSPAAAASDVTCGML